MPRSVTTTEGPRRGLGAAQVAGRGAEVDPVDERAGRLAHDHEDLAGVDRDLAGAARARQPGLRSRVVADHGRVDVAEAVDLGRAEEADVDQPALQVEREELEHRHRGGRAGDDRRVADREREPGGLGAEDPGLVDELEVRLHGPLREVDRDVRQSDADEADPLAGELARRRHDHHLGARAVGRGRRPAHR
jgi:hypothetical protein